MQHHELFQASNTVEINWLNSGKPLTVFEWRNFYVPVFFPDRAEALVRSGGKTSHRSIAHFLSNVSAKKITKID